MDKIKKIGELCRLHYEKILLSAMLLGLAGAVYFLWQAQQNEAEKSKENVGGFERRKVSGIPPVDLSHYQKALKTMQSPPSLNFALPHNVFNPVKWQRKPDGTLLKIQTGKEVGPSQVVAGNIRPLNFTISLERVSGPNSYWMAVTKEAAEKPADRRKKQVFAALNSKTPFFTLVEVKGPQEDPTELVLSLPENDQRVSVTKDKPYVRVEGYEADLKYPPESKDFKNLRVGGLVHFAGEDYNIVAITENEVVLSARLNDKKYTVRLAAAQ